jgi:hypothetical protein
MNDKVGIPELIMMMAVICGIIFLFVYSIVNWPT